MVNQRAARYKAGMNRARFEQLVEEAIAEIPEPFQSRLADVEVVVEDEPSPELLREMGMHPRYDTLFGLYQGVPLSERGATFGNALPDRITIYFRPLTRAFRTPSALRREIRRTVVHEIGHYFGLDEDQIEEEGY